MLQIDGSYGEGGGQILRSAISLSAILKVPIEIVNIRKGRKTPGLQPQHLTAVKAAAHITGAHVEGGELGSQRLIFEPGKKRDGPLKTQPVPVFDVAERRGSAGSVTLVIQTILPILSLSESPQEVILKGGTHVPASPPFHYVSEVFLSFLCQIGVEASVSIHRYGFYPQGGGEVSLRTQPSAQMKSVEATDRGTFKRLRSYSIVSKRLPPEIAQRQILGALGAVRGGFPDEPKGEIILADAPGPGTAFLWVAEFERSVAGFDALGSPGKRAEVVGREATETLNAFLASSACLDPHLADQVILYLVLANGPSTFTTTHLSPHLKTNLWLIQQFLPIQVHTKEQPGGIRVTIIPPSRGKGDSSGSAQ